MAPHSWTTKPDVFYIIFRTRQLASSGWVWLNRIKSKEQKIEMKRNQPQQLRPTCGAGVRWAEFRRICTSHVDPSWATKVEKNEKAKNTVKRVFFIPLDWVDDEGRRPLSPSEKEMPYGKDTAKEPWPDFLGGVSPPRFVVGHAYFTTEWFAMQAKHYKLEMFSIQVISLEMMIHNKMATKSN